MQGSSSQLVDVQGIGFALAQGEREAAHADLLDAARSDAQTISTLAEGTIFDVLDIAGDWAWGQQGEDGLVGYVALSQLEATGQ